MSCSFHASSISLASTYHVRHVCTCGGHTFSRKKLHKLNIFQLNRMWQHVTVDEEDEEPPQANEHA